MQVILTSLFKRSFNEIFECAQGVYSQRTLSSLFQEITRYKRILQEQPYIGAPEPLLENVSEATFRHIVIRPYFKIIYTVYDDCLYIDDLWDTRRDPQILINRTHD